MSTPAPTFGNLLEQAGIRFRVFDLGRRIQALTPQSFRQFETGNAPYPYPLQRQAWFGLLGWTEQREAEHFVWFLRLPLDETGHLVLSARDGFLTALLEDLARRKATGEEGTEPALPEDSPFGFKPKADTMAVFHAKALRTLGLPPSKFYAHAREYLGGELGWDQWAFVGIQGLADVAARLDENGNATLLAAAVPELPPAPFGALCGCLENVAPDRALAEALLVRLRRALAGAEADPNLLAANLRALARAAEETRAAAISALLASEYKRAIEPLAAVAARLWEALHETPLCRDYLTALAENSAGQGAFNQVVTDLLFIPGMRAPLLGQFRDPERSEALARAVGAMFGNAV